MENTSTAVNWIAYRVHYDSSCNGAYDIGYYQTREKAEEARHRFIHDELKKGKEDYKFSGICCDTDKDVKIEEITIEA
ncbi:hypothetical protein LCGC14_2213500 [marine sediment metagenome]|uniref:Uncharacterized protein n=1 Tax=marine sediment metagenome TaxID=412755 RepID=A0A0F9DD03_9ZZZZ